MAKNLKQIFDRVWAASEQRQWIYGKLGRKTSAGDVEIPVSNRSGYYWVRLGSEGESHTLTMAKSLNKVPARFNLPVRLRLENGTYILYDIDPGYIEGATSGEGSNPFGIAPHTHDFGTGLDYIVAAQRMEPGLVHWRSGTTVEVEAFRYDVGNGWDTFLGDTLDLSLSIPITVDTHRWVIVALDTATNTLTKVDGTETSTATPLVLSDLDSMDVTGLIPLGAVQLAYGDSDLSDYTKFYDARGWLNGGQVVLFDDTEGDPADVSTATADGISDFAARRDHVHELQDDVVVTVKILDGNVTYAKIQNVTALRLLGSVAGGVVEEIPVSAFGLSLIDDANAVTARTTLGLGTIATQPEDNYALLAGRAGGQHLRGGTAASENLQLESTSHATKGFLILQPGGGNVGIGTVAPGATLHVLGTGGEIIRVTDDGGANTFISLYSTPTGRIGYLQAVSGTQRMRLAADNGYIDFLTNDTGGGIAERARITDSQLLMADGMLIATDEVRARDAGGLLLRDDSGTPGIIILDGGNVGIGGTPSNSFHVIHVSGEMARFETTTADADPFISFYSNSSRVGFVQGLQAATTQLRLACDNGIVSFLTNDTGGGLAERGRFDDTRLLLGAGLYFQGDSVRARSSGGLTLLNDAGGYGIYINDSGFVNINTSDEPISPLTVVRAGGLDSATPPRITIRNPTSGTFNAARQEIASLDFYSDDASGIGAATRARISLQNTNTSFGVADLVLFSSDSISLFEILRISGLGRVGILQNTPQAMLHVGAGNDAPLAGANSIIYGSLDGTCNIVIRNSTDNVENSLRAGASSGSVGTSTNHALAILVNNAIQAIVGTDGSLSIKAGTSTGEQAKVGGVMFVTTTATGNVGTGEDTLASYSVPANTLATNNDSLWFEASGTYVANANSKVLRVRFGSSGTTLVIDTSSFVPSQALDWLIRGRIFRTGAATQKAHADWMMALSGLGTTVRNSTVTGLNQTLSGAVTLSITGEAVSNNDITLHTFIVGWDPNNT